MRPFDNAFAPMLYGAAANVETGQKFQPKRKIGVGVLGATGAVGQRFIQLLQGHPFFELRALGASGRSVGKDYAAAATWRVSPDIPAETKHMTVLECLPSPEWEGCKVVFSALPSETAGEIEQAFARAGYKVFSNSKNYRMDADVPLMIPEINPDHSRILAYQQQKRGWPGFIVTNPNCTTIHLALALKPLHDAFGLTKVLVTSLQALSGAGYPGVPSLDIIDNVVPFIDGEEEKVETEPRKILGSLADNAFSDAPFVVSATCTRVAVRESHTETVSVAFARKPSGVDEVLRVLAGFQAEPQRLRLPSAPLSPIIVRAEPDRPQPIYDRDLEGAMSSVVGRVRPCPILDYKFVVLGHNTVRGAAGASILNAELLAAQGYIE